MKASSKIKELLLVETWLKTQLIFKTHLSFDKKYNFTYKIL